MNRLREMAAWVLATIATMAGCGGSGSNSDAGVDSGATDPALLARCDSLCSNPSATACMSADSTECLDACHAHLRYLPPTCGACVLDNSSGLSAQCINDADGGLSCACTGSRIAPVSTTGCQTSCLDTTTATGGSFDDRCAALCHDDTGTCTASDTESCMTDCRNRVSPLAVRCAVCLLDNSDGLGAECFTGSTGVTCACTGASFAPVSDSRCTAFCSTR